MNKQITYKDIEQDKQKLFILFTIIRPIYVSKELHQKVLQLDQWHHMIVRLPVKTEYTSNAILSLINIMNDCANWCLATGLFDAGKEAMDLMFKISELYNTNETE